jgi:hypothetical protein
MTAHTICTREGGSLLASTSWPRRKSADEIGLRSDEPHGLSAFALEDGVVYHT